MACNLAQFLIRRLRARALSLDPPPLRDIAHDGDDGELRLALEWAQADLNGKLGAITSPAKQGQSMPIGRVCGSASSAARWADGWRGTAQG